MPLPTENEAFPVDLPTENEAFPLEEDEGEKQRYRSINRGTVASSPVQDFLMSDDGPVGTVFHSAGRVLKAFGQGVNQPGPATGLSPETNDALKKAINFDKWNETSQKIARAANNVLLQPAAYDLSLMWHGVSGALSGGQAAVAQIGEEVGQPKLGREIAAIPEAFPTFEFRGGMPSPAAVERARALSVIGPDGEAGWKGTAVPERFERRAPAGGYQAPEDLAAPVEPTPVREPIQEPAPADVSAPPRPADIHAAAREIDPESVQQFETLKARTATFRRWIDELRQSRDERVAAEAPHAEEIADLERRLADPETTPRLRKKYEARLEPLREENEAYMAEHGTGHTADMRKVRERLQAADYAMRDLAPKVTAAYRSAQERFPEFAPQEEPRAAEPGPAPAAAAPAAIETGKPEVDAILRDPETAKAIAEPKVNRTEDVPYTAGPDKEGAGLNLDKHLPAQLTTKSGKIFDPAKPYATHEFTERDVMKKLIAAGIDQDAAYKVAHWEYAEPAEEAWYRANGIDPKEAQEAAQPYIDQIQHEKLAKGDGDVPAELFRKPYPHDNVNAAEKEAAPVPKPTAEEIAKAREILEKTEDVSREREREPSPPAAPAARTIEQQRTFIRDDLSRQLVRAGRPKAEADALGELEAAHYIEWSRWLNGALRTAEEMYKAEAAEVLGLGMRSIQPKPPRTAPPRPRQIQEEKLSLFQFFASRGGLKPTADLKAILDGNPFVPGFGRLLRQNGMTPDKAREAAAEAQYIVNEGRGGAELRGGGTSTIKDLFSAIEDEARGRKRYRAGQEPEAGEHPLGPERPEEVGGEERKPDDLSHLSEEDRKELEFLQEVPGLHIGSAQSNEYFQIKAYHGSPHNFDRFDISKIGTGEGAQAYGHGLYFAENPAVAASYKTVTSKLGGGLDDIVARREALQRDIDYHRQELGKPGLSPEETSFHQESLGNFEREFAKIKDVTQQPRMYQVSIKAHPDEFLDWDKPLSEQHPHIQDVIGKEFGKSVTRLSNEVAQGLDGRWYTLQNGEAVGNLKGWPDEGTANYVLKALQQENLPRKTVGEWLQSTPGAEHRLREAGIPGIKYLDQGSRTRGSIEAQLRDANANIQGYKDTIARMPPGSDLTKLNESLAFEQQTAERVKQELADHKETRNYVVFDDKDVEITHKDGSPVSAAEHKELTDELFQRSLTQPARGRINILEGRRPIITLMHDANASTFIHEKGHEWLEQLLRFANEEATPQDFKETAQKARDWLGMKPDQAKPTRSQHERFANGFIEYLYTGTAPSKELATVFARFRTWLLDIYKSIRDLVDSVKPGEYKPINEDIRQVFDRMLAQEPERTVIAPEREVAKGFADIHEADVESTPQEHPAERTAANVIQSERDSMAAEKLIEENDARLRDVEEGTGSRAPGSEKPNRNGNAPGPVEREGGGDTAPGEVGAGGGEAPDAGAPALQGRTGKAGSVKSETPPSVNAAFTKQASPFVDKAGNFVLNNITDQEDIRQAIRDSVGRNHEFIDERRGVVSDAEALKLAEAMGLKPSDLDKRAIGEAWNKEEIIALEQLFIEAATNVSNAAKTAAEAKTEEALLAYGEAEAQQQMILDKVAAHASGVRAEAGRALQAYKALKKMTGAAEAHAIADVLKAQTGRTLFQLQQRAQAIAGLTSPAEVAGAVAEMSKPGYGAMALEIFKNWLISGPITHATYHIANRIFALYKATAETAAQAAVSQIREAITGETGTRSYYGEVGAQLYAMFYGQRDGWKAAYDSFKAGQTMELPHEALDTMTKAERAKYDTLMKFGGATHEQAIARLGIGGSSTMFTNTQAVPGVLGTIVRFPGERMVAPIHSYNRTLGYIQSIARQSYRMAANEGLSGNAFNLRLAQLTRAPTEEMMTIARNEATQQTLMGKGGELTKRVSALMNWDPNLPLLGPTKPFAFIDPFVHIASNIVEQAEVERSPFGLISERVRADVSGKNGSLAQDTAIARIVMGTSLSLVGGGLAMEGFLIPSAPSDPKEAALSHMTDGMPHSLRIGNMSIELSRLGVLGFQLGIAADLYHVAHAMGKEELSKVASLLVHSFTQNFLDEGFMRGPSDVIKALDEPDKYGEKYVRNLISSFAVPFSVGMAQVAHLIDPYAREARSLLDVIKAKVPWWSETLMPRVDVWGEPIPNREWRGVYVQEMKNDRVNARLKDVGLFPAKAERTLRGIDLTPEQYYEYAKISGRHAKMKLNALVQPGFEKLPKHLQAKLMSDEIAEGRKIGADAVILKSMGSANDIMAKSVQNKESIITDKPKVH